MLKAIVDESCDPSPDRHPCRAVLAPGTAFGLEGNEGEDGAPRTSGKAAARLSAPKMLDRLLQRKGNVRVAGRCAELASACGNDDVLPPVNHVCGRSREARRRQLR